LHTSFFSRVLGSESPYSVLLPSDYETSDRSYPVLYFLHGQGGNHRNWLEHTRIARHAADLPFVLVFPDAANSWYSDAADGSAPYERWFIEELMPHVLGSYRVRDGRDSTGVIGLSMGGFGAVKLALQYPALFGAAASHSGSLLKARQPEHHPVFGDARTHPGHRRRNDPFWLAEWRQDDPLFPALYLDCGREDDLLEASREFHDHLTRLGIPHDYHERPGYHTWPYWNRAAKSSLEFMASKLVDHRP
jgi:putative tributyrin esterase